MNEQAMTLGLDARNQPYVLYTELHVVQSGEYQFDHIELFYTHRDIQNWCAAKVHAFPAPLQCAHIAEFYNHGWYRTHYPMNYERRAA